MFRFAMCTLAASCVFLGGDALAGKKKAPVSVSTAAAGPPSTDGVLLGQQVAAALPSLIKQVSVCQVVHSVTSSPCGVNALTAKIVPKLFPLSIKKFPVNATTLEALKKMNADFNIEADALALKEPYEVDLRIPSIKMGSVSTARADAITMEGQIELSIQAPGASVQAGKAVVDFTGTIVLNVYPSASK